jgi:anti-anti-sigma factor
MGMDKEADASVTVTWLDGVAIVALGGEWDLYRKEQLHDAMSTIGQQADVVVDIRRASFFDSSALGEMIAFFKRITHDGHRFELLVGNSNMVRLLELTGLRDLLVPTPDRLAFLEEHLPVIQAQ